MQIEDRARIATRVFNVCAANSDTFEGADNLGANVAYLMGAILKGERFEASCDVHRHFIALLSSHFAPSCAVWRSIDLMGDNDLPLPARVKGLVLTCARTGKTVSTLDDADYPLAAVWVDYLRPLTVKP